MSTFKDMLGSGQTLFANEMALDFNFIPKLLPFREQQQRYVAACIKPLLQDRNGKSLVIHGPPGVGKTAAVKHLFRELEEEIEGVKVIYINCWQKNTTFKIFMEICDILDYKFTANKKADEIFTVIQTLLNKGSAVFCFDEIDKVEDFDFLYHILEGIYKKTILLITNYKEWIANLDERIRSRLTPEMLEFKRYNAFETREILRQRMESAFIPGAFEHDAFEAIARKAGAQGDIRMGLQLLREAANVAENNSSKKVLPGFANEAISKMAGAEIKPSDELDEETKFIFEVIKRSSGKRIGDIFKEYQTQGGKAVYKTFARRVEKLSQGKFINLLKTEGGAEGNTTIVNVIKPDKKLTDF